MIAQLNSIFTTFMIFAKANPIIASAVGLWGMSVITFVCRGIPTRIWDFIVYQSTTELQLNSQDEIYFDVLEWVSKHKLHRFVRTLNLNNGSSNNRRNISINGDRTSSAVEGLSIGYGAMYFFHDRKFFMLYRLKESANQTANVKETLSIRVLGRNQKVFGELFHSISKAMDEEKIYTKVYAWNDGYWELSCKQFKRDPETVIIDGETEKKLDSSLSKFLSNREWYIKNGVPYRLGILLKGPPGTGKTSLIKAICAKYDRNLYLVSLGALNDESFLKALAEVPEKAIVAIEDIDAQGVTVTRTEGEEKEMNFGKRLSISGLLNGLDGAASSEDRILIATTNYPDKLDAALIREGRFDVSLTIGNMELSAFTKYMGRMYEGFELPDGFVLPAGVAPAKVQRLVFENQANYQAVLEALK